MAIKIVNDEMYDMITHKNSKFSFCNFNDYLNRRDLPVQYVRHTTVSEDVHRLLELQKRDWSYFIGNLFEIY